MNDPIIADAIDSAASVYRRSDVSAVVMIAVGTDGVSRTVLRAPEGSDDSCMSAVLHQIADSLSAETGEPMRKGH